jgi:hypothetical protein
LTKQEITLGASSVVRHLATVLAGILAAHGIAGGDQLAGIGSGVAVFIVTVGWSFVQNNKLIASLFENLPVSELESLCGTIAQFRSQGSNPLLISHLAQAAMAIAQQELLAAHPELALPQRVDAPPPPPPPVPASVAPEPAAVVAETAQGEVQ